jgi:hypothetical protein
LEHLEEQDEEGLGVRLKKHMEMLYWVRLSPQKTQQLHCIEVNSLRFWNGVFWRDLAWGQLDEVDDRDWICRGLVYVFVMLTPLCLGAEGKVRAFGCRQTGKEGRSSSLSETKRWEACYRDSGTETCLLVLSTCSLV